MHDEALHALPELLDQLGLERPILVGHSDGGSIALVHAGGSGRAVTALVLLAPHVMVEDISVASIAAARTAYETTDLRAKLARYHADVDSAFWGWNHIWLHQDFRAWNIEEYLPGVRCPVLAIQGEDDEYGTMAQVERIAAAVPDVEVLALEDCRHSPHRDQPEKVIEAIARFVRRVADEVATVDRCRTDPA
jgi:pimeloyl-ACP methyl ester carboxylesterase